jgi:uncharacterized protein involved in response to NO
MQTGGIPRYRPSSGPALFQAGFRPFFLAAGLWAPASLILWLAAFAGNVALPTAFDPLAWHTHELIFGFAGATVAGFLLTAIPNWTGRLPLQGPALATLFVLWVAGRAAATGSAILGAAFAAGIDLLFPATLLLAVAREIIAGRNWRNLPMLGALALLLAANALMHAQAIGIADSGASGMRLGIAILLMLVALVGGRIIPSFTRNWLVKQGESARLPSPFAILDRLALATGAIALAAWVGALPAGVTGPLLIAAGAMALLRLARWRGLRTASEPLLLILHVGHAWLAGGLLLLGASELVAGFPASAALHALTVGAIGTMTLAVMTRATLGHTGRALAAGPATTAIYALITLAAAARIGAAFAAAAAAAGRRRLDRRLRAVRMGLRADAADAAHRRVNTGPRHFSIRTATCVQSAPGGCAISPRQRSMKMVDGRSSPHPAMTALNCSSASAKRRSR